MIKKMVQLEEDNEDFSTLLYQNCRDGRRMLISEEAMNKLCMEGWSFYTVDEYRYGLESRHEYIRFHLERCLANPVLRKRLEKAPITIWSYKNGFRTDFASTIEDARTIVKSYGSHVNYAIYDGLTCDLIELDTIGFIMHPEWEQDENNSELSDLSKFSYEVEFVDDWSGYRVVELYESVFIGVIDLGLPKDKAEKVKIEQEQFNLVEQKMESQENIRLRK